MDLSRCNQVPEMKRIKQLCLLHRGERKSWDRPLHVNERTPSNCIPGATITQSSAIFIPIAKLQQLESSFSRASSPTKWKESYGPVDGALRRGWSLISHKDVVASSSTTRLRRRVIVARRPFIITDCLSCTRESTAL